MNEIKSNTFYPGVLIASKHNSILILTYDIFSRDYYPIKIKFIFSSQSEKICRDTFRTDTDALDYFNQLLVVEDHMFETQVLGRKVDDFKELRSSLQIINPRNRQ